MTLQQLNKIIQSYKVGKGEQYTNTSMAYPKISFNIPDDKYTDFIECYCECVKSGNDVHITEKPLPISPLRIDLDFRFEYDGTNIMRLYTKEAIEKIINAYCQTIAETFEVSNDNIVAYLFEKEKPSTFRSKIKDGIHIIFPDIKLSYEHQHFIRNIIMKNTEAFADIPFINKIDDVVDEAIIDKNCWLLYGSKKIECLSYKTTECYKYGTNGIVATPFDANVGNMVKMFSMRNTSDASLKLKDALVDNFNVFTESIKKKDKRNDGSFNVGSILDKFQTVDCCEISNLVKCLSTDRANNYKTWIELGWCLYNIKPNEDMLQIWIEFSKNGHSFKEGECEKLWSRMTKKNLTIGSLKYWAKTDNPDMYKSILDASIEKYIDMCIGSDGAHYDVAKVIAVYMKDQLVYDKEEEKFYRVNTSNIWSKDKEFMSSLCGYDICKLFIDRSMHFTKKSFELEADDDKKQILNEKSKKCLRIAQQLKNTTFVGHLTTPLKGMLIEEDFITKKLDANINLLAFKNRVYDMEKCEMRPIEPTDYIQITTGYEYPNCIDEDIVQEVYNLIGSMFKTEEMFSYVLDVLTYIMYGKNKFQEFYIFTGIGSNGKSLLMKLIKQAFGDYAVNVNATTFTKESKGANETTEMYKCKGVRSVLSEEPSDNDQLITSRLKEWSGDGSITVRGLFKNPITFTPQFTMMFACNDIPKFSKVDGNATLRRTRIIEFPFRFCEKPIGADDKHIDIELGNKIENDDRYKCAFMHILMQNWKKIKNNTSMNTPTEVLQFSKQFIDSCNDVKVFIEQYYIIDQDLVNPEEDKISCRDLYIDFKFRTKSNMTETTFGNRLNDLRIKKKVFAKSHKNYRIGIKPKPIEYDDEDE